MNQTTARSHLCPLAHHLPCPKPRRMYVSGWMVRTLPRPSRHDTKDSLANSTQFPWILTHPPLLLNDKFLNSYGNVREKANVPPLRALHTNGRNRSQHRLQRSNAMLLKRVSMPVRWRSMHSRRDKAFRRTQLSLSLSIAAIPSGRPARCLDESRTVQLPHI